MIGPFNLGCRHKLFCTIVPDQGYMGVDNFWRVGGGGLGMLNAPQIFVATPTSGYYTYFTLGCACNDFKKVVIYNSHSFCKYTVYRHTGLSIPDLIEAHRAQYLPTDPNDKVCVIVR